MDPRDFNHQQTAPRIGLPRSKGPLYTVTMSFSVDDADALWQAAAAQALAMPGMTMDDIVEVIGPPEDPSIRDCLLMLCDPARMAGCDTHDIALEEQMLGPLAAALAA